MNPTERSNITERINHLSENITALSEQVDELLKRLQPVLTSSVVEEKDENAEDEKVSPLAKQLTSYSHRLQSIRSLVANILERLDL